MDNFDKNKDGEVQQPKPTNIIYQSLKRFKETENIRAKSETLRNTSSLDLHYQPIEV